MTPSTSTAVNSFFANPSGGDYLSGSFRPARAISRCRARAVIGGLSPRDLSLSWHWPSDLARLSRDDISSWDWDLIGTTAEQGIDHVTTIPEAVIALGELDLPQTAKRVAELDSICGEDDSDEPDVDLESLKRLVRVMQANPGWGEPSLALAGEKNCIHAEWPVRDGGRVTISFLPSNRVDYTASSAPATDDDALDIAGHHLEGEAIRNLHWFTDRIVAR